MYSYRPENEKIDEYGREEKQGDREEHGRHELLARVQMNLEK